jgi:hypothetical protein
MAFDRPLESDRVDDLSLLGLLTRAPVIGSIMWLLGGQKARDEEEREIQQQRDLEILLKGPPEIRSTASSSSIPQRASKSALRKSETLTDALDDMHLDDEKPLKRQRKNISWSDEGGKDLVEFIGQVRASLCGEQRGIGCAFRRRSLGGISGFCFHFFGSGPTMGSSVVLHCSGSLPWLSLAAIDRGNPMVTATTRGTKDTTAQKQLPL